MQHVAQKVQKINLKKCEGWGLIEGPHYINM